MAEAFREPDAAATGVRRSGAVLIVDAAGALVGIFTDADFRRAILRHGDTLLAKPIADYMTRDPRCLKASARVRDLSLIHI